MKYGVVIIIFRRRGTFKYSKNWGKISTTVCITLLNKYNTILYALRVFMLWSDNNKRSEMIRFTFYCLNQSSYILSSICINNWTNIHLSRFVFCNTIDFIYEWLLGLFFGYWMKNRAAVNKTRLLRHDHNGLFCTVCSIISKLKHIR